MDAEKIKELRELVAAATGGTWRQVEARPTEIHAGPQVVAHVFGSTNGQPLPKQANARLIAAAVNSLPALLDEVEALRELALAATDTTPERRREKWSCHYGITTARNCSRCGPQLALLDRIAARHEPKDAE